MFYKIPRYYEHIFAAQFAGITNIFLPFLTLQMRLNQTIQIVGSHFIFCFTIFILGEKYKDDDDHYVHFHKM